MDALIDAACTAKEGMKTGDYPYPDDDTVIMPSGGNPGAGAGGGAALTTLDPSIAGMMSTARPEKLLRNDGMIESGIVHSVAVPEPGGAGTNRSFDNGTKRFNFKSFLEGNATWASDSRDGIGYYSNKNSDHCER